MLMFNFAHEGHTHVDGAPHISGGISIGVILISISIVLVAGVVVYQLKNRK